MRKADHRGPVVELSRCGRGDLLTGGRVGSRDSLLVVGGAILDGDRCLVAQRGPGMALQGKWEFPGGKVERGEGAERALRRELEEELGLVAEIGDWLGRGETWDGERTIRLDVYAATAAVPEWPEVREHFEVRWVGPEELAGLDWAPADVPVLPAVRGRLIAARRATEAAHRCVRMPVILAADWGQGVGRRAACVALPSAAEDGWRIDLPSPPDSGWTLTELVQRAVDLRDAHRRPVILGVDAVLGVPTAFGRAAGGRTFGEVVASLAEGGGLSAEARTAADWSPARPFFRVPHGAGGLRRFVEAAGGRGTLFRQIELRTGAKSVFVLSGIPGSVGSGSRVLWRELQELPRSLGSELRRWPFDGTLAELTAEETLVLVEVYPRAAYAVALAERLPPVDLRLAKSRGEVRAAAVDRLLGAAWVAQHKLELAHLENARRSEDLFDALLAAAALVRLVGEGHPLAGELVDPELEGGILTTA